MHGPDPRKPVRREIVAAIIGAEAGVAIGLLAVGATPLVPLALAAIGAGIGTAAMHLRHRLFRRWLRAQLRSANH
jgi:hypothetical protein